MRGMIEQLSYFSVDELQSLSLEELRGLWELVPTDRQKSYRTAYDREVRNAGAIGSDELERQVSVELLRRYDEASLVPIGSRWARTPQRVQDAARDNDLPDGETDMQAKSSPLSPKVILGLGVICLVFLGWIVFGGIGGKGGDEIQPESTEEPTETPVLEVSPTPTPLALEAQDDVITGGDSQRAIAYPVNLQVVLSDDESAPARVWVVQRREVRTAEWNYDSNPDIASFVNGMSVRPVIGIPWSEENETLFDNMEGGTVFTLTMNTGAILRFEFGAKTEVLRSDTGIFRQVSPGLVLLLIGETDTDGLPTATRTLVTASYPPEQELARDGELLGLNGSVQTGEVGSALTLGETTSISLRHVAQVTDLPNLAVGQQALLFDLEIMSRAVDVDTSLWRMELVDSHGQVYLSSPNILNESNFEALPVLIPSRAMIPASIGFVLPDEVGTGQLVISDSRGSTIAFNFALETVQSGEVRYDGVDVRLVSVRTIEGQITTQLRIYNGHNTPITFTQDDIWLSLGYASDPPGPRNPAEGLQPFTLLPEQAVDLTLIWYWAGEPYASLAVGAYRFAIQVIRNRH